MMMLVTVTFSEAAFFWTAFQRSSATRMVRVGVLGALGIRIFYTVEPVKNCFKLPTDRSKPPASLIPLPSITASANDVLN